MSPDTRNLAPDQPLPRGRVALLSVGGVLIALAAWIAAPVVGPPIAIIAGIYGWLACRMLRPRFAPAPAPAPPRVAAPAPPAPPSDREKYAALRHDLRGILSPALMISDRLLAHDDPTVKRAGDVVARTVQRATDRLEATKDDDA